MSSQRNQLTLKEPHPTEMRDRFRILPSLAHAVIYDVLRRAARGLFIPDAGRDLDVLGEQSLEIAQTAAGSFVRSVLGCAGYWFGVGSSTVFSAISALPYEGRSGTGNIIFAKADHPAIDVLLRFRELVDINNTRAVRKLIEASGADGDLLSTGDMVYGIGQVKADYDSASETVFVVSVAGRGTWELSHADRPLLTVRDGSPHLPRPSLNVDYFIDITERLRKYSELV